MMLYVDPIVEIELYVLTLIRKDETFIMYCVELLLSLVVYVLTNSARRPGCEEGRMYTVLPLLKRVERLF